MREMSGHGYCLGYLQSETLAAAKMPALRADNAALPKTVSRILLSRALDLNGSPLVLLIR